MDELLHHCAREIAFDGDLGSDVSRLKDFIADFYTQANIPRPQNFDDQFYSFVWSLVVQQHEVLVGLLPLGITADVWVAPQTSAKRKAQARGEELAEMTPPRLEPIPNAQSIPLETLIATYGDRLRLAVEPEAIFAAITGSHIRSSKLSPMVYSALQIITRGRDSGVTVVDLGQRSGYDQKTCFYLVRQLTELDLVMKVRRGGVGTHLCIHKYFFERSLSWKAIRDEEKEAGMSNSISPAGENEVEDTEEETKEFLALNFTPIDARHLSSLPLVSARVIKLLKASKNHIHASNNMLLTLGFPNPTKTDRRFFQSRIREMIQQGIIEKVVVPNSKNKTTMVKCFRLVQDEKRSRVAANDVDVDMDDDLDDNGILSGVKVNISIYKQIIDLLEDSGTSGMTLNDLSSALHQFDKRTIELYLTRADKCQPPEHLNDLRIAGLMETSGRERRHRYYTVLNYQKLVSQEALDKTSAGYDDAASMSIGGFLPLDHKGCYDEDSQLLAYQDGFKEEEASQSTKKKANKRLPKNPVLPDGTVKKGRPLKNAAKLAAITAARGTAPASSSVEKEPSSILPPDPPLDKNEHADEPIRKRGRTRKQRNPPSATVIESHTTTKPGPIAEVSRPSPSEVPPSDTTTQGASSHQAPESTAPLALNQSEYPPSTIGAGDSSGSFENTGGESEDLVLSKSPSMMVIDSSLAPSQTIKDVLPSDASSPQVTPDISSSTAATSGRINVSHLRRENELLRVVEDAGGIINIQSKEFFEAHMNVLQVLASAGEPTSAPPRTRTDKRTATFTFNSLERKGKIKQLKTTVTTHTGATKPACIVYVPSIEQEKLNTFLADLARNPQASAPQLGSYIKIAEPVEYGADATRLNRGILPLQLLQMEEPPEGGKERWSKNLNRANQLFAYDESTIQKVLLHERTTLAQLFGFVVSKALRCRRLHLTVMKALEDESHSDFIVSRQPKIIDISLLCHDLTLASYCSLISVLGYDDDLLSLYRSEQGAQILVHDLPPKLHTLLQIGRSRGRSRFLDMLETLRALKLATPLQPSVSSTPFISCTSEGGQTIAFDVSETKWSINTPMAAPSFWYFHDTAPIFLWAVSERQPPLLKEMDVKTADEAVDYWKELQNACISSSLQSIVFQSDEITPTIESLSLARSLRRSASWQSEYFLTWHQTQYLRRFIDVPSANTPLQHLDAETREEELSRSSWVTSAPKEVVVKYFQDSRDKLLRTIEKTRKKADRRIGREKVPKDGGDRAVVWAKKAEEARLQRENDWKELLARLHPAPLPEAAALRVERVQQRFLQAGAVHDLAKWEQEIQGALRESELASVQAFKLGNKRRFPTHVLPQAQPESTPPALPSDSNHSIQHLIDRQLPHIKAEGEVPKRKRKGEAKSKDEPNKITRRHRFHWTPEYDELARDASAIIRARCRHLPRLDWGAFEQVFPSVPRNTVRQRLAHLREVPGVEAYLRRLEDAWYDLWIKHRGTEALPDSDDHSPFNFDLQKHVEFLRLNIDKNALRIGLNQATEITGVTLPSDVDELRNGFTVVEPEQTAPEWDFMWNALIEEGRERKLRSKSLTIHSDDWDILRELCSDDELLAEGALKMTMGSPLESYNSERASDLLRSRGEASINDAIKNMLSRGVLSKCQRDSTKTRPGRQFKISEGNQNMIGGPLPRDTFQDATSLLEEVAINDNTWHEWPLTATDGDCAALIQLAIEDKVAFKVDTTLARAARPALDWNSKKADDDQIETSINVQYRLPVDCSSTLETALATAPIPSSDAQTEAMSDKHGLQMGGGPACCARVVTANLTDCQACLEESWAELQPSLAEQELPVAEWLLERVDDAGSSGITKSSLSDSSPFPLEDLANVTNKLTSFHESHLFWTGYQSTVLVSAHFLSEWSVLSSKDPLSRVPPRRWLDLNGTKITTHWHAALRAVLGTVLFRPGLSEMEILWRLRSVYDRQEVKDVLRHLQGSGHLYTRMGDGSKWTRIDLTAPFDEKEEGDVYWFIGDNHWYQI